MKIVKLPTLLCAITGLFVSCSKDSVQEDHSIQDRGVIHLTVTPSDIRDYLNATGKETKSSAFSVEIARHDQDTVMYLVNYNEGWELLSANKLAPRVLAKCEKGSMTFSQLNECPAQEEYLSALGEFISSLSFDTDITPQDASNSWLSSSGQLRDDELWFKLYSEYLYQTINLQEHLTETQWYQDEQWNIRAPYTDSSLTTHCYTGCTMVAGAQVLYYTHQYYNKPSTSYGVSYCSAFVPSGNNQYLQLNDSNISFVGVTNTSSTWDMMPLKIESGHTDTEYGCVSTLMVRLGKLLGAKYRRNGTGVHLTNIPSVFNSEYSVQCNLATDFISTRFRDQVFVNKSPMIMSIYHQEGDSLSNGHTIVVDGYKKVKSTHVTYYANFDRTKFKTVYDTPTYSEYIGINWGWKSAFQQENSAGEMSWYYLYSSFFVNSNDFNYVYETVYNFH